MLAVGIPVVVGLRVPLAVLLGVSVPEAVPVEIAVAVPLGVPVAAGVIDTVCRADIVGVGVPVSCAVPV